LHADAILRDAAGQNGERNAIAEALFRRLAERDNEGRYRRSPASLEEVKEIASCSEPELLQVIAPFEDASFVEFRKSSSADEDLLDISHEALIRTWDKARAWTDLEAEKVRKFRGLLRSAEAWRDGHENPDLLKHRPDLELFERWWSRSAPTVSWAKRYFGQNGQGTKAFAAIDLLTRYRDISIEADKREKRRWATLKFIAASSLVAAVFVIFGSYSWYSWRTLRDAQRDAARAEAALLRQRAKTIALRAEDALESEGPAKALLFAMEAQNQGLPDLLETEQVVFKSLKQPMEKRIISEVSMAPMGVAYSPDGKAIVTIDSKSLNFWNLSDGTPIDTYPLDTLKITVSFGRIQWSPAGDWLAISSQDQTLLLAPCSHPKLKVLFPGCAQEGKDRQQLMGDSEHRAGFAKFSNDGRWMVTGGIGATLKRWEVANGDAAAGKEISAAMPISFPNAFAISPDMKKVAGGLQFGKIGIFDPNSGELQAILSPQEDQKDHGSVIALGFNPRDPNIVVASELGGSIFVWDVENNKAKRLTGTNGTAYQVVFSGDGKSIAAASDDGVIRTWKTKELTNEPKRMVGHRGPVYWVAYSSDGTSLASACPADKTLRVWNQRSPLGEAPRPLASRGIGARSSEAPLPRDFGPPVASAESETGRRVVAWKDGRFALYNLAQEWPEPILEWQGPAEVTSLTLEHDSDRLVAVSSSGLRTTWPFFRDVDALIRFARDQIPFNGEGQLTLKNKDRCKIAPPDDSACKPKLEPIQ
jgi:WD40 repeat protein